MAGRAFRVGTGIVYWSGAREGEPSGAGVTLTKRVYLGRTPCQRIQKDGGGTDYIALTHLEKEPAEV